MEAPQWHNRYFLLSWKLWNQLLYPRESAVFNRISTQNHKNKFTIYHLCLMMLAGAVISYGIVNYLRPLGFEFPILALLVFVIFSSIITLMWLVTIAANITHEYQQATYDLICVTPLGKLGANWSIVTGILHRQDLFRWIDTVRKWLSGLILLIFLSVLVPVILSTVGDNRSSSLEGIILFLDVLAFVVFTYVEYIQSVLQSVLIAMLVPRFIRRTSDAVLWSLFSFITLQLVMVIIFLAVGVLIQYIVIVNSWQLVSILPQLLLLFTMREVCIYSLWRLLSYQLNAETDEINHI